MPKHRFQKTVFVLASIAIPFLTSSGRAQTIVASAQSWDALRSDSVYVLQLFGLGEGAKDQFDEFVRAAVGGKGVAWLDSGKPFGAYADLPEQPGTMPAFVVFLPIADQNAFLDSLPAVATHKVDKTADGIYLVQADPTQKFYLRLANKHAYISNDLAAVRGTVRDPATLELGARPGCALAVSLRVDRVSQDYKDLLTAGLSLLTLAAQPAPGESEAEFKARVALIRLAVSDIKRVLNETREITLHLEVDRKRNQLALELALVPQKDSRLSRQVRNMASAGTFFGELGQDATAKLGLRVSFPDEWQAALSTYLLGAFEREISKQLDLKDKALARRLLKAFEPTLKAGYVDLGVALQGPKSDGTCVFVAGLKVEEGKKVDQLFRDFLRDLPADQRGSFTRDFATHRTNRIHSLGDGKNFEKSTDDWERLFGANLCCLSLRDDAILLTMGKHSLPVMKDTLDVLDRGTASEVMRLECSLLKMFDIAINQNDTAENRKNIEPIRKIVSAADNKRDKVSLRLQGGETLRLRLAVDAENVKTAGAVYNVLKPKDK